MGNGYQGSYKPNRFHLSELLEEKMQPNIPVAG